MTDLPIKATQAPIFIVGSPRSGTTMLQFMLDGIGNLSMPTGESHFFIPLYRNQKEFTHLDTHDGMHRLLQAIHTFNPTFLYGDLHGLKFDVDRLTLEFVAEKRCSIPAVIQGIFEKNAAGMGKIRWGDKTPYYALHLSKLATWWPNAKFIHLVRDGRDVALSLFERQHDFRAYNIYYAAQYWQQYVDECQNQGRRLPAGQYLEIRYEDILDDETSAIHAICDFIGEFCPTTLPPVDPDADAATRKLNTVRHDNKEKWRNRLTPWQIRVFESEAGESLQKLGYQLTTSSKRLPLPVRVLYRMHNALALKWFELLGKNRTSILVFDAHAADNMTEPPKKR